MTGLLTLMQGLNWWRSGSDLLENLNAYESALPSYPETPEFKSPAVKIWYDKGLAFDKLENTEAALECYDQGSRK